MKASIVLLVILSILFGCKPPPTSHYYMVHYVPVDQKSEQALPYVVRIKDFSISEAYRRPQIAYRFSPYEINYYNYHLWGVRPQKGFPDLLKNHLERRQLFAETTKEYQDKRPDFEIEGDILAIEEFDNGLEKYGHLAIRLRFMKYLDRQVVVERYFDSRKRVYQLETLYLVKTLSEMFEEEINNFFNDIEKYMKEQHGAS